MEEEEEELGCWVDWPKIEEVEEDGCCCCVAEEKSPPEDEDPAAAGAELPNIDVPDEELAAVPKIDCDCCPEDPKDDCPKALLAPKTDVEDPVAPPPPKIDGWTALTEVWPNMELLGGAVLLWPPPNSPAEEEEG